MSEPDEPTQLPVLPDENDKPVHLPAVPHVPPVSDPDLIPYALWRQEEEQGARAAHDDARLPPDERRTPEDVLALGYAFWHGYTNHASDLRNAGVIQ